MENEKFLELPAAAEPRTSTVRLLKNKKHRNCELKCFKSNHGSSKENEKQLSKTTVFQQLVFSTKES